MVPAFRRSPQANIPTNCYLQAPRTTTSLCNFTSDNLLPSWPFPERHKSIQSRPQTRKTVRNLGNSQPLKESTKLVQNKTEFAVLNKIFSQNSPTQSAAKLKLKTHKNQLYVTSPQLSNGPHRKGSYSTDPYP
jgi:hypothetical protein